ERRGAVLKVGVRPVLAALFLEIIWPNDSDLLLAGILLNPLVVLPRDTAKDLTVDVLLPLIAEEANDVHWDLQELHDHVDEDTIETTIPHADGLMMVLHKRI